MFRKVIHIIIACFILVSTTGFTISLHYCHDKIYDLALFSPAHSCCEAGSKSQCHASGDMDPANHCEDESIVVESTDDYIGSSFTVDLENTLSIDLLLTVHVIFQVQGAEDEILIEPPWHKEPPLYQEVVLSEIQSYLI
ncbi:MAG: hypothetical protein E4H10_05375 [Bacteroidia bacterium]|nr:MAG: hypothetical protein E4H10_05375 [Bacteroidia bacterium]